MDNTTQHQTEYEYGVLTSPPTPGSVLKVKGSLYLRTPSPFGFGLVMKKRQKRGLVFKIK